MRNPTAAISFAAMVALASGSACAMTKPSNPGQCRIVGGTKLPVASGGPQALCAAIEAAAAKQAPGAAYTVQLRVLSAYSLAAAVRMADGRSLPEQKLAVTDRALNRASIDRFANAIANSIAQAAAVK